jgi:hypothetical protein
MKNRWPKEKVQKDKQQSTEHTYKSKDRVTRTPLKTRGELMCSGRVGSSCSTSANGEKDKQRSTKHTSVFLPLFCNLLLLFTLYQTSNSYMYIYREWM